MTKGRRLQWNLPDAPLPKHPVRDTVLVYALLASLVVVVSWLTGGSIGRAVVVAVFFFVVATAWNLYRWRLRLRDQARKADV